MAKSVEFSADVVKLVEAYRAEGKRYMLCKFGELVVLRDASEWEMRALLDAVYRELVPGDSRDARLERNRLARA